MTPRRPATDSGAGARAPGEGDQTSDTARPKYRVLRDALVELIRDLPEGAGIPTERELSERFAVSRGTVRQALDRLKAEQRIVRHQGRGTFVAKEKFDQLLELTSHTQSMRSQGLEPASRLVDITTVPADAETARRLAIRVGAEVVRIERVRLADEEPLALELLTIDAARFVGLEKLLGESDSLYELLRTRFAVELAFAEETIEAVPAGDREADLLGIPLGAPLLLLCRSSFDAEERPVELVRALYRADRFRFRTRLLPARERRKGELPAGTRLRVAAPSDAPALAAVFIAAWRSSYVGIVDRVVLEGLDRHEIEDWLAPLTISQGSTTWVAESARGEVLGFSRVGDDPADSRRGHIYSLYVSPKTRGRGIASAILEHNLASLAKEGRQCVTLWVFERNEGARRLYESFGFQPDGARRVEPQYGAQEVRLRRSCPAPARGGG